MDFIFEKDFYVPVLFAVAVYAVLWIIKNILVSKLKAISVKTDTVWDDFVVNILSATRNYFILGISIYVGIHFSILNKNYGKYADGLLVVLVAMQMIAWAREAVDTWINITIEKKNNDPSIKTSLGFVGLILKFILISLILLAGLNNLGVNVSTFITGLGVGGVAIALATQNVLGDLFSSLSIVFDKPFVIGDFVSFGEWSGTIENIGLKTTRIKSISGEQIVVSNSDLLASKIRNFKRMQERRVVFRVGVTYSSKREDLKKVPGLIEGIISKCQNSRFDRSHFVNYGDSSLDFETVYFVTVPDYKEFADIHQRVLFDIHEAFEANNLDFAFPTRTIVVEGKLPV